MGGRTSYASLPAHIRAAAERHPANRALAKRVARAQRRPDGFDSKGEAEFAAWLTAQHGAARWRYHAVTLTLPGGSTYTPDMALVRLGWPLWFGRIVLLPSIAGPSLLDSIELYEVMPRRKRHWRGLGSKEAQAVRIRECAAAYPWARFIRATPDAHGWSFETVGAEARAS